MAIESLALTRSFEPLPPHNTEAEESVLGSLLIDPEAIEAVANFLRPEDFYHPRNRDIYAAMLRLYDRRQPTDFVMVCDELERSDLLEPIGGIGYLSRILTIVPTSIHVEFYGRVVQRTAVMRRLIQAAGHIAAIGYEDVADIREALERAEQELFQVTQLRVTRDFMHIREVLAEYLEQIQLDVTTSAATAAIPTGYIDLDRLLGGFQRSDLIILAARPSLGKTALALNIARNCALRFNMTTAIFSVEMSRVQIAQRFLSTESEVDSSRVREGRLSQQDIRKLSEAVDALSVAPIYIDDTPAISISELRAKARRLHGEHPVDLIIVDYLQLVNGSVPENRVQAISEVSRSLKALARELNVPLLALSQLSRAVESRSPHIPMLSDLRDSGSIEQDADVVMFIYREDAYDRESERKGITEIHVAKHRNGPTGIVNLLFLDRSTRFVDLAQGMA